MRCVISDAIEKVFVSFFYYFGYRGFVSNSRDVENPCPHTIKKLKVKFEVTHGCRCYTVRCGRVGPRVVE